MGIKKLCLFVLLGVALASAASRDRNQKKYKVVCYFDSWTDRGQFLIKDLDPFLCTHLIYGYAKVVNDQIAVRDPNLDLKKNSSLGGYQMFNNHKKTNPQLTTLIAVSYNVAVPSKISRATFIKSVIDYCQQYDFDGLYLNELGSKECDDDNFIALLRELKAAFEPHGLILTAAVLSNKKIMEISKYFDFINVRTFEFRSFSSKVVVHPTPLYPRPEESEYDKYLNVEYVIDYWIRNGVPRSKIILGMATYGRAFTLANPANHALGSAASYRGVMYYREICQNNWTEVFVAKVEAPYAYSGNQWVGYDNVKSIGIKVDYLIKQQLGGGWVGSMEDDDFRGNCSGEKYPLLSTIARKLNVEVIRQTVDPNITVTNTLEDTSHTVDPNIVTKPLEDTSDTVDPNIIVTKPPVQTTAYPGKGFKNNLMIDYIKFKLNFFNY